MSQGASVETLSRLPSNLTMRENADDMPKKFILEYVQVQVHCVDFLDKDEFRSRSNVLVGDEGNEDGFYGPRDETDFMDNVRRRLGHVRTYSDDYPSGSWTPWS